MNDDELRRRVHAVPWATLAGAYGSSERVDKAFQALIDAQDADDDDWSDAVGVFGAHVMHQGDLYEVAPYAVPFLAALARCKHVASRAELEELLAEFGENAASYARSADPVKRALGERVLEALARPVEAVELPPRRPPPRDTDAEVTSELERHAREAPGAAYARQSFALARAEYFAPRAPELALRVAEAVDDPPTKVRAALLRARALGLLGRNAEAVSIAVGVVRDWCASPRAGVANQVITRRELLEVINGLGAPAAELQTTVARAPEPEIVLPDDDSF